ncbi:c-type cytochrome [Hymenobacter sp. GOD-10R]|uniref:c-type cytochrome n=1 Tax=Hymenobacter sp. GOD-10R TaxID=3093922 RepID=UPI002D768D74|nr:c-type cytochrome [Hymenobacter sp. GOD-10R]WRQ26458.1 c-type cytochrome [Hymenobacter sp. GOD-10R]
MKKFFKILGGVLGVVVLAVIGFVVWVQARGIPTYDKPTASTVAVAATPERLELGRSLVLASCNDCHMNKKNNKLSGQQMLDTPKEFGSLYSANITQDKDHGIGNWTDGEVIALLRTGIGRDGRYRIIMPHFVHMSDEDVNSVVAFLRSDHQWVQADATPTHAQEPSLLVKTLVNTVMKPTPMPTKAVVAPAPTDQLAYGRYLVVGRYQCFECHSKSFETNNALEPEKSEGYLGGGNHLLDVNGVDIVSRNLTGDSGTGIGDWNAGDFTKAVKFGMSPNGPLHAPMPKYSTMSDGDAAAIFAYLQSIPKIKNATPEDKGAVAVQ